MIELSENALETGVRAFDEIVEQSQPDWQYMRRQNPRPSAIRAMIVGVVAALEHDGYIRKSS